MKILLTIVMTIVLLLSLLLRCVEILISTIQFMWVEGSRTLKAEYSEFRDMLSLTWKKDEKGRK